MKKTKSPSFSFYSADFLVGTMMMTDKQVGQYIRLLCYQHQSSEGKISEDVMLSITKKHDPVVWDKFQKDDDGMYYNERLLDEIQKRFEYVEVRRDNALKRWNKEIKDASAMQVQCKSDASAMLLEDDNKDIVFNDKKIVKDTRYFDDDELNKTFLDFMKMRKSLKNGAMTDRAIKMMINKLNAHETEIAIKMLEQSILNNWKDIFDLKESHTTYQRPKGMTTV